VPLLKPALPLPDRAPNDPVTPEDLPAPPAVHPAAPQAPPAGEATPVVPPDEGDAIFGEE
jgi:hypothetical protein